MSRVRDSLRRACQVRDLLSLYTQLPHAQQPDTLWHCARGLAPHRADPPRAGSREDLSQWLCRAHNAVNARLGKPMFNCVRADARWALDHSGCGDACGPPS